MDRHAQKQVLLARIAYERVELRRDVARLREATGWARLLREAIGGGWGRSLFGAGPGAGKLDGASLFGLAGSLLRRYRFASALFGAGAAVLGGRSGSWRRVVKLGVIGAAAWLGWQVVRSRGADPANGTRR